jgi:hypothetical protein
VRVGITNSASDVSLFIAHKRGYFRDAGMASIAVAATKTRAHLSAMTEIAMTIPPGFRGIIEAGEGEVNGLGDYSQGLWICPPALSKSLVSLVTTTRP